MRMTDFLKQNVGKVALNIFALFALMSPEGDSAAKAIIFGSFFGSTYVLWLCEANRIKGKWLWTTLAFFFPYIGTLAFACIKAKEIKIKKPSELSDNSDSASDLLSEIENSPEKQEYLASLIEGRRPTLFDPLGTNFILDPDDFYLWVKQTESFGIKKGRKYQSGSRGASIRIAKGVTWHVGGSKGRSVSVDQKEDFGKNSIVAITNKSVFVQSSSGTIKQWSRSSINGSAPYKDGIRFDFKKGIPLIISLDSLFDIGCAHQAALFKEKP